MIIKDFGKINNQILLRVPVIRVLKKKFKKIYTVDVKNNHKNNGGQLHIENDSKLSLMYTNVTIILYLMQKK